VHAVRRASLVEGGTAAVVGVGMIGLLVVQALRALGTGRVIAVDIADDRLNLARTMGAEVALNAASGNVAQQVRDVTDSEGADAVFEVVGGTETLQTAIDAVRKGGNVTLVGNVSPTVELPLQAVVTRELTLYGSCASQGEYPQCIELMAAGKIDVAPLISAVAPLEEGPLWFERLYAREPGLLKVILAP
jgi:threonine dehydrogenase-like Zn-dependent dehydrogenase